MKVVTLFLCAMALVIVAAVSYAVGAAFTLARLPTIDEKAAILLTGLIAAVIALIAAGGAFWGVYSQRVLVRRQATIEHIGRLESDSATQENIKAFIGLTTQGGNLAQWANEEHAASKEARTIQRLLNDYELISIGIQRGIFEYELVRDWNRTSIQRYWSKAHPYVVALRDRVGAQTLWQEFEKLNGWVSGTNSPTTALWWTGFG